MASIELNRKMIFEIQTILGENDKLKTIFVLKNDPEMSSITCVKDIYIFINDLCLCKLKKEKGFIHPFI